MARKHVTVERVGPAKKAKFSEVEKLAKEISTKKTVMVVDLTGMPSREFAKIRHDLKGKAEFRIKKKTVIRKALEKVEREGFSKLVEMVAKVQPALILTNDDPFKIARIIGKHVSPAFAKAGKVTDRDIVVPKGETGLPPGPAIGELQKANLPAKIEKGKIVVSKETVVAKAGEKVSREVAEALLKLGIEPFEVRLRVVSALEDGVVYPSDALFLDDKTVIARISNASGESINLAVFVSWPTKETVPLMLAKAVREANAISSRIPNNSAGGNQ